MPTVVQALNGEVTRLTGKRPIRAIHAPLVNSTPAVPAHRNVGFDEVRLPSDVCVCYLYAPGELEGGEQRRATDPIWSVTIHTIERSVVKTGEPVLYYLSPTPTGEGPKRAFVCEELQIVPPGTETP